MELINPMMKVVYKGTKEEFYEVYELCHQLELRIPNFYCRVVEADDCCYLEISFEKMDEFYVEPKRELSDRVKDFYSSFWVAE